jgi:hypothetical protein
MVTKDGVVETRFPDSLDQNLQIGLPSIRAVGPAAETLATLISISTKDSFVRYSEIARRARLPETTVKKHIAKLQPDSLENKGRQPTRSGWVRRTTTIRPTKMALGQRDKYILLPWWARCNLNLEAIDRSRRSCRLSWSEKVLFGFVISQFIKIQQGEKEAIPGSIACEAFNRDRYQFSLSGLSAALGLDRKTIVSVKRSLHRIQLIDWSRDEGSKDWIAPNFGLKVRNTPAEKPGFCHIELVPN